MSAKRRERNDRTFVVVVGYTGYGHIGRKETRQPNSRMRRLRVGARSEREARELVDRYLGNDGHGFHSVWEDAPPGRSLPRGFVADDLDSLAAEAAMREEPMRRLADDLSLKAEQAKRAAAARRETLDRKRRNRERRRRRAHRRGDIPSPE